VIGARRTALFHAESGGKRAVWRLRALLVRMARTALENVLRYLWELSDGTRAYVIGHAFAPQWEICLVRRDRVLQRQRCETVEQLMAASMGLHAAASSV
jgi:hypothetical protein